MSWTFAKSDDPEELNRRIEFLQSCLSQRNKCAGFRPRFIPARVILPLDVRSEAPFLFPGFAVAGEHECTANQWGAISVKANDGKDIGIRPHECVVVSMTENPKWKEA